MNLHCYDGDARRLDWSLSLVCEWLRRTEDQVLDELADFGFGLRTEPRRHLAELIDQLEAHAAALGQRPPAPTGAGGAV